MKKFTIILFLLPLFCKAQDDMIGTDLIGKDTVKVLMFVTDSSQLNEKLNVYGIYGYSVREKHCCIEGNTSTFAVHYPVPFYKHLYYLDEKKKPLPKNIIVWQAKDTK